MSRKNSDSSEDEKVNKTQPAKDLKIEKITKKNVKAEKVKQENECRRKLGEISPPKVRKILHKTMSKYHNNRFYTTNDIVKKILTKLKVSHTPYFINRMKKNMEMWIRENVADNDSDKDSSNDSKNKESKDLQMEKNKIPTKDEVKYKASNINIQSEPAQLVLKKPENVENNIDVPPGDDTIKFNNDRKKPTNNSVKVGKGTLMIDLTLDVKKEVKNEEEIITIIDEDTHHNSNKAISTSVNENPQIPIQQIPYPVISGYNPTVPGYPGEYYQPYYYNPNMYSPYFLPYGYQYPYSPCFYRPSDYLPNYPVDETESNNSKVINDTDPKNAEGS